MMKLIALAAFSIAALSASVTRTAPTEQAEPERSCMADEAQVTGCTNCCEFNDLGRCILCRPVCP